MIVAGVAGAVLSMAAMTHQRGGVDVLVAARPVVAGEVMRRADMRIERIDARSSVVSALVPADEMRRVTGKIATTSLAPGEVLGRSMMRPAAAPAGRRAMSLPVDPALAVAGRLAAGDRVDVLAANNREAGIVVADLEVLAVDARALGGLGGATRSFTITVAVDADESEVLAGAIADGDVIVTRATGASPAAVAPGSSLAGSVER